MNSIQGASASVASIYFLILQCEASLDEVLKYAASADLASPDTERTPGSRPSIAFEAMTEIPPGALSTLPAPPDDEMPTIVAPRDRDTVACAAPTLPSPSSR